MEVIYLGGLTSPKPPLIRLFDFIRGDLGALALSRHPQQPQPLPTAQQPAVSLLPQQSK